MTVLHHHDRKAAQLLIDDLADVYEQVYAEPPYSSAPKYSRDRFVSRFRNQILSPGFALVTVEENAALAGFATGFALDAGSWWANTTPPPQPLADSDVFAIVELILLPGHRGHGKGKALLDELLAGRPEPYATLAAVLDAPAYEKYLRWGWVKVGEFRAEPPYSDALAFRLTPDAPAFCPAT
ncbi:hypothetical protein GCM10027589_13860 [Actinocorallia lasiicapitis]